MRMACGGPALLAAALDSQIMINPNLPCRVIHCALTAAMEIFRQSWPTTMALSPATDLSTPTLPLCGTAIVMQEVARASTSWWTG